MLLESSWEVCVSPLDVCQADHGLLLQVQKRSWRAGPRRVDWAPTCRLAPSSPLPPAPAQRRLRTARHARQDRSPWAGTGRGRWS